MATVAQTTTMMKTIRDLVLRTIAMMRGPKESLGDTARTDLSQRRGVYSSPDKRMRGQWQKELDPLQARG